MTTSSRDHPRVCGEHVVGGLTDAFNLGSSPRVRGTLDTDAAVVADVGIIPACAGNTASYNTEDPDTGDHPRVCGEHLPV